jgi:hypothetical protein
LISIDYPGNTNDDDRQKKKIDKVRTSGEGQEEEKVRSMKRTTHIQSFDAYSGLFYSDKEEPVVAAIPNKEDLWFEVNDEDLQEAYGRKLTKEEMETEERERKKLIVDQMDAVKGKKAKCVRSSFFLYTNGLTDIY